MHVFLLQHGQAGRGGQVLDSYSSPLTPEGLAQARRLGESARAWGVQLLCSSTMVRAEQTADAIAQALGTVERREVQEFEELNVDDLLMDPSAGPLIATWTPQQLELARRTAWSRVMPAWARIELYAQTRGYEHVAIVGHANILALLLLGWLGLDWRALAQLEFPLAPGSSSLVVIGGERTRLEWLNRLPPA